MIIMVVAPLNAVLQYLLGVSICSSSTGLSSELFDFLSMGTSSDWSRVYWRTYSDGHLNEPYIDPLT